jgi:hypothetical protein
VASVAATAAVARAAPASHQHSPEVAAFLHHSHHFLRVRQQPEVRGGTACEARIRNCCLPTKDCAHW